MPYEDPRGVGPQRAAVPAIPATASDGDVLVFDGATQKWIARAPEEADGVTFPITATQGGTGADTSGADDGDVLTFDDASGTYLPVAPAGGGAAVVIVTKAAADSPYALGATDTTVLGNTVAGNLTVTLPAAPVAGRIVNIKKISAASTLTIDGNGKTIDGAATVDVTGNYINLQLQYTGTEWSKL